MLSKSVKDEDPGPKAPNKLLAKAPLGKLNDIKVWMSTPVLSQFAAVSYIRNKSSDRKVMLCATAC